jgi:hypothetical protein
VVGEVVRGAGSPCVTSAISTSSNVDLQHHELRHSLDFGMRCDSMHLYQRIFSQSAVEWERKAARYFSSCLDLCESATPNSRCPIQRWHARNSQRSCMTSELTIRRCLRSSLLHPNLEKLPDRSASTRPRDGPWVIGSYCSSSF